MAFTNPSSTRSKRAMAARKEFEEAWTEAGKMFASPQDGSKAGSKGKKASQLSYRREESPGGTVHEYYADGTEKIPDESTSKPIRLGQRIVLGYANRAPVEGLVAMHRIFGNESDRLNATFETNDSDPEVEFLNRAALRALPEEEMRTTAQLARLTPTGDPSLSVMTVQLLEEIYKEQGKPNEAEMEVIARCGRVNRQLIEDWFAAKERRIEPHLHLLDAAGIKN